MRHIDTSHLWLQQEHIKEKIKFDKVEGTENPADMNTKGLSGGEINKYIEMLDMKFEEGRAELAPDLVSALHNLNCKRFNSTAHKVTKKVTFKEESFTANKEINECTCDCMDRNCSTCKNNYV